MGTGAWAWLGCWRDCAGLRFPGATSRSHLSLVLLWVSKGGALGRFAISLHNTGCFHSLSYCGIVSWVQHVSKKPKSKLKEAFQTMAKQRRVIGGIPGFVRGSSGMCELTNSSEASAEAAKLAGSFAGQEAAPQQAQGQLSQVAACPTRLFNFFFSCVSFEGGKT